MHKILLSALLIPSFCFAGSTGQWNQVKNVYTWAHGAENHFMINIHNPNANTQAVCPGGFWYAKSTTEEDHIWEVAMYAYKSKTKVHVHFDDTQDWPSMSVKDCKIIMIELEDTTTLLNSSFITKLKQSYKAYCSFTCQAIYGKFQQPLAKYILVYIYSLPHW